MANQSSLFVDNWNYGKPIERAISGQSLWTEAYFAWPNTHATKIIPWTIYGTSGNFYIYLFITFNAGGRVDLLLDYYTSGWNSEFNLISVQDTPSSGYYTSWAYYSIWLYFDGTSLNAKLWRQFDGGSLTVSSGSRAYSTLGITSPAFATMYIGDDSAGKDDGAAYDSFYLNRWRIWLPKTTAPTDSDVASTQNLNNDSTSYMDSPCMWNGSAVIADVSGNANNPTANVTLTQGIAGPLPRMLPRMIWLT